MEDAALIVTWSKPIPGREKKALDYGAEVNDYYGKLAADGKCSAPEMFFFTDGHGLWMVKGDFDAIASIMMSEEAQRLSTKGTLLLQDFAYRIAWAGKGSEDYMVRYATVGQELGIV